MRFWTWRGGVRHRNIVSKVWGDGGARALPLSTESATSPSGGCDHPLLTLLSDKVYLERVIARGLETVPRRQALRWIRTRIHNEDLSSVAGLGAVDKAVEDALRAEGLLYAEKTD